MIIGGCKISLITVVFNRAKTISSAIDSVLGQEYENIEYLIVDGMSDDGTDKIVNEYGDRITCVVREPDEGLYDALNKGIRHASGEVIGFLHADDVLNARSVISSVANAFLDPSLDAVYGDLCYVDAEQPERIIRYWKAGEYSRKKFRFGWMPPHPTVYLRRTVYEQYGNFRLDFGSAADYECMLRHMYRHNISVKYIPEILVRMRVGGTSNASIFNRILANRSDRRAWQVNGFKPPLGLRFSKPLRKVLQYFVKPPNQSFTATTQPTPIHR